MSADMVYQIRKASDLSPLDNLEIDGRVARPVWGWPVFNLDSTVTVLLRERDGTLTRRTMPRDWLVPVFTTETEE